MGIVILDEHGLAITGIVTVGFQLLTWGIAYTCKTDKLTDISGSLNFIINAILALSLSNQLYARAWILAALLVISRLELGSFLLYRVLQRGHDARFNEIRENPWKFLGFFVFQMIWAWAVSLPIVWTAGQVPQPP